MRYALALVWLVGCGGAPAPVVSAPREAPPPVEPVAEPVETPPPTPCVAAPPSRASLAVLGRAGVLRIDASAPRELGACVSPATLARAGEVSCDASGQRCAIGEHEVLIAREIGEQCVPVAVVRYPEAPAEREDEAVLAALALRDEACALHDRVAREDAALYDGIERARRIAMSARALAAECLADESARALAEEARARFAAVPLVCEGLRCESAGVGDEARTDAEAEAEADAEADADPEAEADADAALPEPLPPPSPAPAGSLLFANRVSGPLRFDAVAWVGPPDHVRALELLRRRCR